MGHYGADEIKLEAQATFDISIQLHNLLKYIYVCDKTQPLTSKSVAVTIGEAEGYKDNNEPTCDMIKSKKTVMINQKHLVIQINITDITTK